MIARTDNFELRKLVAPGLVSPAQVVGVLPPWYRAGELGHIVALTWLKTDLPIQSKVLAYAGSGTAGPPRRARRCARGGRTARATMPTSSPKSKRRDRRRSGFTRAGIRAGARTSTAPKCPCGA